MGSVQVIDLERSPPPPQSTYQSFLFYFLSLSFTVWETWNIFYWFVTSSDFNGLFRYREQLAAGHEPNLCPTGNINLIFQLRCLVRFSNSYRKKILQMMWSCNCTCSSYRPWSFTETWSYSTVYIKVIFKSAVPWKQCSIKLWVVHSYWTFRLS